MNPENKTDFVEEMKCVVCGKIFWRRTKPRSATKLHPEVRKGNCKTCSKHCAREWISGANSRYIKRRKKMTFKKPCRDCEKNFQPLTKYFRYCDDCIKIRYENRGAKIKKFWKNRRLLPQQNDRKGLNTERTTN